MKSRFTSCVKLVWNVKNVERISVNCFEPTEHLQHLKSFNNNKDPPSDFSYFYPRKKHFHERELHDLKNFMYGNTWMERIPRWKSVECQEYSHYLSSRSLLSMKIAMNNVHAKFAAWIQLVFHQNLKSCRKKTVQFRSTPHGINARFNLQCSIGKSFQLSNFLRMKRWKRFETDHSGFWWIIMIVA